MNLVQLPISFDQNEWFVLASILILLALYWKLPKILPRGFALSVMLYFALFGLTSDLIIGVDYPVDYYDVMDNSKFEVFDMLIYFFNYTIYGYFFAYVLVRWRLERIRLILVLLGWIGLSVGLEWLSQELGVYTYKKGWNISASFVVYIFFFIGAELVVRKLKQYWRMGQGEY